MESFDKTSGSPRRPLLEFIGGIGSASLGAVLSCYAWRNQHVAGSWVAQGNVRALNLGAAALIGGGVSLALPLIAGEDWKTRSSTGAAISVLTRCVVDVTQSHRGK
jgi:hypothetical protein